MYHSASCKGASALSVKFQYVENSLTFAEVNKRSGQLERVGGGARHHAALPLPRPLQLRVRLRGQHGGRDIRTSQPSSHPGQTVKNLP